jgi:hypothetical protein
MINAATLDLSGYSRPAVVSSSDSPPSRNRWEVIAMALVVVIVLFGSAAAYCWAVCGGHVHSCATSGGWFGIGATVTATCSK